MTKVNYYRKLYRMLGLGFPIVYLLSSQSVIAIIAIILMVASLVFDVVRLRNERLNQAVFRKIKIMKEKEKERISATTIFLAGIVISLLFFPRDIAILAISFTVIGDALAEIIGSKYKRIKMFDKSLEGNIACFLGCLAIGIIFNAFINVGYGLMLIGSIAATIAQALPLEIDDNLTMQLISGAAMLLIG